MLKQQAKRLRASLAAKGHEIAHGEALETVARQYGYRDWNTLSARARPNRPRAPVHVGDRVCGDYLGQRFSGTVLSIGELATADRFRMTVRFDEPVDVVTFDSFSAYRRRVQCVVDGRGVTPNKTSNGRPHLRLTL